MAHYDKLNSCRSVRGRETAEFEIVWLPICLCVVLKLSEKGGQWHSAAAEECNTTSPVCAVKLLSVTEA